MSKYLSPALVSEAFARLSTRDLPGGKVHKERTSALMYFCAFDATCRTLDVCDLDLNPESTEGLHRRKQLELEFSKLVLLGNGYKGLKQVVELGKIDEGGTSPEKRISSNFFTVPLTKASRQAEPYFYPSRPDAPVLKMGLKATGKKWGIAYCDGWTSNLLRISDTIRSPTPLLDLALFVCRDCAFADSVSALVPRLSEQIGHRFTKGLTNFWVSRIEKEVLLARHLAVPFVDSYSPFANGDTKSIATAKPYSQMKKSELIDRIHQLESMLSKRK